MKPLPPFAQLPCPNILRRTLFSATFMLGIATIGAKAAPQPLAADAAAPTSGKGAWQSAVIKIKTRNGTTQDATLRIEFEPASRDNQNPSAPTPPSARAKLFLTSTSKNTPAGAEASSSLGNASSRDVRLLEKDGVRTITITRAVPPDAPKPEKTQRNFDRFFSVSFRYELKDNVLTLKGFPEDTKVNWGVTEFSVSQPDIAFKPAP